MRKKTRKDEAMKKKVLCLFLAMILALGSSTMFTFAANIGGGGDAEIQSTFTTSFSTKRISDTKAAASVSVNFNDIADDFVISIILQKKTDGKWVSATDITNYHVNYRGSNRSGYLTYDEWTVKKGGLYRVKCVSTDKYDRGVSYTSTTYSDPF